MGKTILIVDDDPAQRRLLQAAVERNGFLTRAAENGAQAVEAVEKHADIDIVLLDLVMPGMTGQEALKEIRMRRGDLPCIVLTASGGIDTVVQAMQAGASDFFVKPASPERIMVSIRNALEMSNLKTEVGRMKKKASGQLSFDDMVANAAAMGPVVRMGRRAAASNIPVLITGESGLGKSELGLELISRGHGLVADDAVDLYRVSQTALDGRCPDLLLNLLEVRGIGLLDIKAIFGETAVRRKMRLKLIVHLVRKETMERDFERLPYEPLYEDILDIPVRKVVIAVDAGRNLAVLVEAAVRNTVLQLRGIDTYQEFIKRHQAAMDDPQ